MQQTSKYSLKFEFIVTCCIVITKRTLDHFGVFKVILVILGVCCYFGHYVVFGVILVILEFSRLCWSFLGFEEYFGHCGIF